MKPKHQHRTVQYNAKLTPEDADALERINHSKFGGALNKSELARKLLEIAIRHIDGAELLEAVPVKLTPIEQLAQSTMSTDDTQLLREAVLELYLQVAEK